MGYFDSVSEFLAMGSHGLFVWVAYGSALLALLGHWVGLARLRRRVLGRVRQLRQQEGK